MTIHTITQNLDTIIVAIVAVCTAIGMIGSALESIGKAIGNKRLEVIGDKIEAIGFDLPKLFGRFRPPPAAPFVVLLGLSLYSTACAGSQLPCNTVDEIGINVRYLDEMRENACTGGNIDQPRCDAIRRKYRAERFAAMECVQ